MVRTAYSLANHVLRMRTRAVTRSRDDVYVAMALLVPCAIDHVLQERMVEIVLNHAGIF